MQHVNKQWLACLAKLGRENKEEKQASTILTTQIQNFDEELS